MILDQIHDSDYAHLRPKHDSLFSDDEDVGFELDDEEDESPHVKVENGEETLEGDVKGKKRMRLRDLEDEEDERRKELEAKYGIDGTKQVVSRASGSLAMRETPLQGADCSVRLAGHRRTARAYPSSTRSHPRRRSPRPASHPSGTRRSSRLNRCPFLRSYVRPTTSASPG